MAETLDSWPAGATWVFQGSVAEDATAGTHVCTLTVTPGAGNEMQVLYGRILEGNTATAQLPIARITDGTNLLADFINGIVDTSANIGRSFPSLVAPANNANQFVGTVMQSNLMVSGTQVLLLQVSTAAVSVTQTFAVVARIKGEKPTAVLNDTIGTSTNTVNTNHTF